MNLLKFIGSFFFPSKVEGRISRVSGRVEVVYSGGRYVLDSAHVNYSFGGLHQVLQKAFSRFSIRKRNMKNALILGFGSGSAAHILRREYGMDIEISGVEIDQEVIDLAKKYFEIDTYKGLTLQHADAFDFVHHSADIFDLILMDVFIDLNVPDQFYGQEFVSGLGRILSGQGILFFNVVVHNENVRQKGARLFEHMNALVGKTEWCRITAGQTENWVFVADRSKMRE